MLVKCKTSAGHQKLCSRLGHCGCRLHHQSANQHILSSFSTDMKTPSKAAQTAAKQIRQSQNALHLPGLVPFLDVVATVADCCPAPAPMPAHWQAAEPGRGVHPVVFIPGTTAAGRTAACLRGQRYRRAAALGGARLRMPTLHSSCCKPHPRRKLCLLLLEHMLLLLLLLLSGGPPAAWVGGTPHVPCSC